MAPLVDDPRILALRSAFERRPAATANRRPEDADAAVAIVVRPREQLEILLIKRAERDDDPWSGHMALPGGRRAATDVDLITTAMRETEEETRVPLHRVGHLLGRLDELAPASRVLPPIVVTPFALAVPADTDARADGREAAAAIWVPLAALRDEGAVSELLIELSGESRRFPSLRYGEHVIWGITHRILTQFLELTATAGV
jgi:8-oxo-dGTP pyrophosphatase MutT (NUDIX family)